MEEKEIVERRTVRHEEPLEETTNVNVAPDGTTNVEESGDDDVVVEDTVVEERREP